MLGITDLTTFIIGTTLIVLLPGPNSLYVMSIASRYGIKTGYLAAFGVFSGDLILIILTILIIGVQIGIAHGKRLQIEDIRNDYEYICAN